MDNLARVTYRCKTCPSEPEFDTHDELREHSREVPGDE